MALSTLVNKLDTAKLIDWLCRATDDRVVHALACPDAFAEFCFTDSGDHRLQQAGLHRDLQAFFTANRRGLVELPRDHGKSVQACIRVLWELGHNPSLRVKIVCASDALAAERSRFLRQAIAHNPLVRAVFPHLRPARPWSQNRFTVRRPANVIGPSVAAFGVGAASTGGRADLLLCDDIVDVKALRSRAERQRVKDYFRENLMNQLEPDGRFWGLFTPWHADDLNAELKKNAAFPLFRRAVGDNLEPVWPEKWSGERLAARRQEIGSLSFARGYRLVCIPDEEVPIRAAWVQFWIGDSPQMNTDEHRLERQEGKQHLTSDSDLCSSGFICGQYERVILSVDPAVSQRSTADCSALVTLGKTASNQVHCLEAIARRVSTPDLIELIDDADRRWRPELILFESNAAFAGIKELLVRHARFGGKIKPIVQTRDKVSRVHAFSVPVENGVFRLRGAGPRRVHPGQQALFDEMTSFPFGEHDDLLDAAATGTAYVLERPEPRIW